MFFEALALPDECSLQDDAALLVALAVLGGKLIDPAQLAVAVLTADVLHHVCPSVSRDPVPGCTASSPSNR